MNNDLISRSELKKAIIKRLGIKSEEFLLASERTIYDEIDNAPTVDTGDAKYLEERDADAWESGYIQGLSERPQGESISLEDGLKKARRGKYVIYDVDFLLDNLAREVNIMESARQMKAGRGNDND